MTETKIVCHGAKIQKVKIPEFTLKSGDLLCLHWPLPRFSQEEEDFLAVLTGKMRLPAIDVCQPMVIVKEPFVKTYLWGLIDKKVTVFDALQKNRKLSAPDVQTLLNQLNLSPDTHISELSLTHKMLLAIEATALMRRGVIFTTAGLDPHGVDIIHATIAAKLQSGFFAIHFSYPTLPPRVSHGKGKCVECHLEERVYV